MPEVYEQIFEYAKQYIKQKSIYSPTVLKNTPEQINLFPLVIIKEIDDPLIDENLDKTDQRFKIVYEIEIYTINKGTVAKQEITKELVGLVNEVLDEHYGFTRRANNPAPNIDLDVDRRNMRYEAKIDENKRIYRR